MIAAFFLLLPLAAPQDDRDTDAFQFPSEAAEAERRYRQGNLAEAEKALRELLRQKPDEEVRRSLCQVLLRTREYAGLQAEAEALMSGRKPLHRAFAWAMKAFAAWKLGTAEEAHKACAEAERLANESSPYAFPDVRRIVRCVRAFVGWKRHECGTHVIYYPPDSPIAGDIVNVGRRLDDDFVRIQSALDALFEGKIEAYLFNDQGQADAILGWPLNFSAPRDRAMYALHHAGLGHHVAHILSFYAAGGRHKERPRLRGLIEGFATAFAGDALSERRMREIPSRMLRREELPALDAALRQEGDAAHAAVLGSFVRWMYETKGKNAFIRFWVEYNDHEDPWKTVYGVTLRELEEQWRSSIE